MFLSKIYNIFTNTLHNICSYFKYSTPYEFYTYIDGHKYDLSDFNHPGGDIINLAFNIDSKLLIETNHPQSSLPKIYKILNSRIIKNQSYNLESKFENNNNPFFEELNYNISNFLKTNNYNFNSFHPLIAIETALSVCGYLFSIYKINQTGDYWYAALNAFFTIRFGFLMHSGNHASSSPYPIVNRIISYCMDLGGASSLIWRHEHQLSHHLYTNIIGKDNDCDIGNPIIRLHPHIKHRWWHRYQLPILFLGMTFGLYKWIFAEFYTLYSRKIGSVNMKYPTKIDFIINIIFKIFFLVSFIFLPTYYFGFKQAMILLFIRQSITSLVIENIFIVNHIQPSLHSHNSEIHWSINQIKTSCNWSSNSRFFNWFTGGLNNQIEHHLFPTMNPYLYTRISPIVKNTCKKHHIPYNDFPTFWDAWISMIKFIHRLSNE